MVTGAPVMSGLEAFEGAGIRSPFLRARLAGRLVAGARGHRFWDEHGREYLDFFSGAGGLNYGHNPPQMTEALIGYLQSGGILHSLDMATTAKRDFLLRFDEVILRPRGMSYKVMFRAPRGPTRSRRRSSWLAKRRGGGTSSRSPTRFTG